MSSHCLEIYTSQTDENGDEITDWQARKDTVQTWLDNHEEVLQTESSEFSLGEAGLDGSGTAYAQGLFRFDWTEDAAALKDDVGTWLTNNFEWWRIRYHECTHDEDNPSPCLWSQKWEHGTVPNDIPDV